MRRMSAVAVGIDIGAGPDIPIIGGSIGLIGIGLWPHYLSRHDPAVMAAAAGEKLYGVHWWDYARPTVGSGPTGGWSVETVLTNSDPWQQGWWFEPLYQQVTQTHDAQIITRVDYTWVNGNQTVPAPTTMSATDWANKIVSDIIAPLGSYANRWVIGNEPNIIGEGNGWPSNQVTPAGYAAIYHTVRQVIKAQRPQDEVLFAPVSPGGVIEGVRSNGQGSTPFRPDRDSRMRFAGRSERAQPGNQRRHVGIAEVGEDVGRHLPQRRSVVAHAEPDRAGKLGVVIFRHGPSQVRGEQQRERGILDPAVAGEVVAVAAAAAEDAAEPFAMGDRIGGRRFEARRRIGRRRGGAVVAARQVRQQGQGDRRPQAGRHSAGATGAASGGSSRRRAGRFR